MIGHLYASDGDDDGDHEGWQQRHQRFFQQNEMTRIQRIPAPDDPDIAYDIFAAKVVWRRGAFDSALRAIADDELRVMWMSNITGAIFAPYDGGTDLILPKVEHIRALTLAYSDWLSSFPEGW
jgi:hypothetical protein